MCARVRVFQVRHVNCILFLGACSVPPDLIIVTEFASVRRRCACVRVCVCLCTRAPTCVQSRRRCVYVFARARL